MKVQLNYLSITIVTVKLFLLYHLNKSKKRLLLKNKRKLVNFNFSGQKP